MEAARLFVTVGANTRSAEAGLKSFNDRLKNAARSMTTTGTAMTVGITAPLMAVAGAALKSAGDFEQSMNILQQVTGASADTMADLQAQALELGASTVFSAGEAAEGMLELAKAGMDTEQVMAAIPGVMDLAAAANVGLGEAAGITAAAINAFGLEASEATRVADMLAAGANASAADITDLAAGLQQAGFAFDMANQPIENLIASLAILTNVGLTGSDAGTALKNAFMRMMNPTQEALDLMNELGISFYDAQGSMMALPAIIDNLNAALSGLTPQQRDAALATIFMSDGMKAMIPLLDAGSSGFNDMVGNVTQVGAATDVAGARMQGMAGAIEYLKGSVDSFLIGAALPFLDTLGGLARGAADALTRFGALPQPIINTSLAIAGIVAATGPVLVILGTLAGALSAIGPVVAGVVVAVAALGAAWAADFGGIQSITATVAGQVTQAFSQILAGAQQLAAGIGAAFSKTSFPSLETLWQQFQAGDFQRIADTLRDTTFELMVNLDAELNITAQAEQLKARLLEIVNGIGLAVSQFTLPAVDWGDISIDMSGAMTRMAASINQQDWTDVGRNIVKGIGGGLGAALSLDVTWAENFANGFAAQVRGGFADVEWGELNTAFSALAEAVRQAIYDVFSGMGKELGPIASDINASFSASMEKTGASIRTTIGTTISGWNTSFSTAMENLGAQIREAIGSAFSNLMPDWLTPGARPEEGESGGGPSGGLGTPKKYKIRPEADTQAMTPLNWADYVKPLDWMAYIKPLTWQQMVQPLTWQQFVNPLEWQTFVQPITWSQFVQMLNWSGYIARLSWNSFVASLGWNSYVGDLDWGTFVPKLDWGRFIPSLVLPGNAAGTSYWRGGPTWVGEEGPEIVDLPRGARIYSNDESMAMTSGMTVNISVDRLNNDMDIHSLAVQVAREIARRSR